ncbi:MAG TPA: hypothetical protein VGN98_09195, partial [Tianweitania sediminis]|nr:hypothetical protein [Tianweitania sediminis]
MGSARRLRAGIGYAIPAGMADAVEQVADRIEAGDPVDPRNITAAMLCAEVFRRHGEVIRIRKEHVAVPNLEKILLAALELSARNGFHSTTTRD